MQENRALAPFCAWATPRPREEDAEYSLWVQTNMMLLLLWGGLLR